MTLNIVGSVTICITSMTQTCDVIFVGDSTVDTKWTDFFVVGNKRNRTVFAGNVKVKVFYFDRVFAITTDSVNARFSGAKN